MEHQKEEYNQFDEEGAFHENGCNCFQGFFKWSQSSSNNESESLLLNRKGTTGERETWLVKKLKDVKEVSEKFAGPKWKTFIRKISGYGKNNMRKQKNGQFQYDPQSYALNFDDREEDYSDRANGL